MKILIQDGLPFTSLTLEHRQQSIVFDSVLLDTGSVGAFLAVEQVDALGLVPEPDDPIYQVVGVGGSEYVFSKTVDTLALGNLEVRDFAVEFGAMKYGFDLDGIIGLDFLMQVGAIIDLNQLEVYRNP